MAEVNNRLAHPSLIRKFFDLVNVAYAPAVRHGGAVQSRSTLDPALAPLLNLSSPALVMDEEAESGGLWRGPPSPLPRRQGTTAALLRPVDRSAKAFQKNDTIDLLLIAVRPGSSGDGRQRRDPQQGDEGLHGDGDSVRNTSCWKPNAERCRASGRTCIEQHSAAAAFVKHLQTGEGGC